MSASQRMACSQKKCAWWVSSWVKFSMGWYRYLHTKFTHLLGRMWKLEKCNLQGPGSGAFCCCCAFFQSHWDHVTLVLCSCLTFRCTCTRCCKRTCVCVCRMCLFLSRSCRCCWNVCADVTARESTFYRIKHIVTNMYLMQENAILTVTKVNSSWADTISMLMLIR